jgi:hypothetical protein
MIYRIIVSIEIEKSAARRGREKRKINKTFPIRDFGLLWREEEGEEQHQQLALDIE